MDHLRRLRFSLLAVIVVVVFGTAGYCLIERWPLLDALYMTVITLASVGFREVHDLSDQGRLFTIVLIVSGTGIIVYTIGSLAQFTIEGQLQSLLGRKKVEKGISKLKDHYIICGYGRIGALIARELRAKPLPFVVVEQSPILCDKLNNDGYLFVQGNATDDETLLSAGILHARGLITVVTSDTDNVYITLTARGLNPDLFILARAGEEGSEKKLQRAGATKVISPYTIGATRMAHAILRPSVMDFIEIATAGQNFELQLEEILVSTSSILVGKTLITSGIRKELGLIVVGIKKGDGQMVFNPPPDISIEVGDILISLGQQTAIQNLERIAQANPS